MRDRKLVKGPIVTIGFAWSVALLVTITRQMPAATVPFVSNNQVSAQGWGSTGNSQGTALSKTSIPLQTLYGYTALLPLTALPTGGDGLLDTALAAWQKSNQSAVNWNFVSASSSLPTNSLQVNAYQAGSGFNGVCGNSCYGVYGGATMAKTPSTATAGNPYCAGQGHCAGFVASYTGPGVVNGNWIQAVLTNNPNQPELQLDNASNLAMPYYGGAHTTRVLADAPQEPFLPKNAFSIFDTYYVSSTSRGFGGEAITSAADPAAPTTNTVTIYNGVEWGYFNFFDSAPSFTIFATTIDDDLSNVASLETALGGADLTEVVTQSEINQLRADFDVAAASQTPEPADWCLLLTGIAVIPLLRKAVRKGSRASQHGDPLHPI